MHILYIMGQDSGGLPHYTAELANSVANEADVTILKATETSADDIINPDVDVINCFRPTDISMQNIFDMNINVYENAVGLLSYRNINIINYIDPDIVHDPTDEFPQVSLFSYLFGVHSDRPYVVTSHEVSHGASSGLLKIADAVESAPPDFYKDAAIVHSEKQAETLKNQDRNIGSVQVIPHGVYDFFTKQEYEKREEREAHALFFGSVIPPKGIEYLVRAVPHIVKEIPEFTLTIAGSGTIPEECSDTLREYESHIEVRNEFIPNDEVGELFSQAQVVVLPYRSGWQTGHSGTLSIAYAFGKPVVSTDVGSFYRMVEDSGAGVVTEPESPEAIADGVVDVLSDDQRRSEMKKASAEKAEELSWGNIAQQHMSLYRDLV